MNSKSQSFWDRVSSKSSKVPTKLGRTALLTVEATQRHLASENVVFDYGCGTGDLTIALAQGVKAVHGIDTSSGMIEVARARASQCGVVNLDFAQSSIFDDSYPEGTFNVVTAFNVLQYVEESQKVFRRISDLLSPEGLFISSTACLGERKILLGAVGLILTKLGSVPDMTFFRKSELEDLITRGGFRIVETERLSWLPEYFVVAEKV